MANNTRIVTNRKSNWIQGGNAQESISLLFQSSSSSLPLYMCVHQREREKRGEERQKENTSYGIKVLILSSPIWRRVWIVQHVTERQLNKNYLQFNTSTSFPTKYLYSVKRHLEWKYQKRGKPLTLYYKLNRFSLVIKSSRDWVAIQQTHFSSS